MTYLSEEVKTCRAIKSRIGPKVYDPAVVPYGEGRVMNVDKDSPWQFAVYSVPTYPGLNRKLRRAQTIHHPARDARMLFRGWSYSRHLAHRFGGEEVTNDG